LLTFATKVIKSSRKITLNPKKMKKLVYIFLISLMSSLTIISCTEEEVSPSTGTDSAGGGGEIITGKS
jgi:hypothetical protein